ncbi:hypothetical protein [Stakelama saccharophila]|uniref:1,4-alpha-glucan branching enzyme n=1 Tax=Stakelama saccharophila TaxID=3075605 RepID=A0ABZ0B979_9SPHN|nr:hypothetical protein [Stakelama sp. W311]WNO52869.1 hypothetical protein RPR59_10415 [Stakelama sp. W311]
MSEAERTTDHDTIRKWVEDRDGTPSVVEATADNDQPGALLRIDFRELDEGLRPVEWDEFFRIFDENNLAFLYQDRGDGGGLSRFNKFVDRNQS